MPPRLETPVPRPWPGVITAFRERLPLPAGIEPVTLLEGMTPLVPAPGLRRPGVSLHLKLEGANPTGSFKDRGMTVAVTAARAKGARLIVCASTGNTSASAAAYAARAGMGCLVVIPEGAVAHGKLAQAAAHGAVIVTLRGNFDDALLLVRRLVRTHREIALVNSVNPFRLEGQKTAAFEILLQLPAPPTHLALPVGNAGNITAYGLGFRAELRAGRLPVLPRLLGFQAAGAAPLVLGHPVQKPETVATAIRIGKPASGWKGAAFVRASRGTIRSVSDEEILKAYALLARKVGVFAEPASAASIAGLLQLDREGVFVPGDRVVAVLTGHGLKDPDTALALEARKVTVPATFEALQDVVASVLPAADPEVPAPW